MCGSVTAVCGGTGGNTRGCKIFDFAFSLFQAKVPILILHFRKISHLRKNFQENKTRSKNEKHNHDDKEKQSNQMIELDHIKQSGYVFMKMCSMCSV